MKKIDVMHKEIQKLVEESLVTDTPVYGMVIHEASDLCPESRYS